MKTLGALLLFALVACCAAIIPVSIHLGSSHRYAPSYGHHNYGHGHSYGLVSHHHYPSYGYGHGHYGHHGYGHHGYGYHSHSPSLSIGFGKR